jgi:hypothetical protein
MAPTIHSRTIASFGCPVGAGEAWSEFAWYAVAAAAPARHDPQLPDRRARKETVMPVEVHVTGRIELGQFAEFVAAAESWRQFRHDRGDADCRILQAVSGEMNTVRLVFVYPDLNTYEQEESRNSIDPEYARIASTMPFVRDSLAYEIYRTQADLPARDA